jgi:hypothetical protein
MRFRCLICWLACLAFSGAGPTCGADIQLGPQTVVSFADVTRAKEILTQRDEFIQALSPFDRSARMKVGAPVTEDAFIEFVGASARAWTAADTSQLEKLLQALAVALEPWRLPLPRRIELIKTSGQEEGDAAYTRQNAIILSQRETASANTNLLTHELFHVLSRSQPKLREQLYGVIGFKKINELVLPKELADIKITDPDGVSNSFMVEVKAHGEILPVVPILLSSSLRYDPVKGGEFFRYLTFKFLAVEIADSRGRPRLHQGKPYLLDPASVEGFYEQIGRNTEYILHPDEILADNFVALISQQTNLPAPRIVSEMKHILSQSAALRR